MERKWWTLAAVCIGTFMLLLDLTIITVALPEIRSGLGANFSDIQWVLDAYALSLASLLLTTGALADRYGRRLLFSIGLVVFTLGSLLCGLAQSPLMLILSRTGQGVGGAIMFSTSLALLANSFRGKDRGAAFGAWGLVMGMAVSLGPILGGLITTGISWRGIFLVNVPIGVVALGITFWAVKESRAVQTQRLDWVGFLLLTAGLVGLVFGLIRAGEQGWGDRGAEVSLASGGVLLVAFLVAEWRSPNPMFDLSLFRTPTFVGGSIAAFTMNGSLFAMLLYLVLYLQDVGGYSALGAGLRLALISAGTMLTSAIAGRLSSRVPVRFLVGPGLLLVGVGLLLMQGITASSSWTHLLPGFLIAGLGAGLVNPPLASTAVGVVKPAKAGMASGVNATFRQVGIATGIAALGTVFTSTINQHLTTGLSGHGRALSALVPAVSEQIRAGDFAQALALVPTQFRGAVIAAARGGFVAGLNQILIITAIVALMGAVLSLLLIRPRDFVHLQPPAPRQPSAEPETGAVATPVA